MLRYMVSYQNRKKLPLRYQPSQIYPSFPFMSHIHLAFIFISCLAFKISQIFLSCPNFLYQGNKQKQGSIFL